MKALWWIIAAFYFLFTFKMFGFKLLLYFMFFIVQFILISLALGKRDATLLDDNGKPIKKIKVRRYRNFL
jgi:hypothetical protein